MADFEDKWKKLTKAFQKAIKGETLWSSTIQKINRDMKQIVKKLDEAEVKVSLCCNSSRGHDPSDAEGFFDVFKSSAKLLKKGNYSTLVRMEATQLDKRDKPKTYRALKVLETGIEELSSLAEYKRKGLKNQVAAIGKELAVEERVAQVQALALKQVKKAVKKARACLQKVKSEPTATGWKNGMNDGMTRDVCMGLRTLVDAQSKGSFGSIPDAAPHKEATRTWNTGQPSSDVPNDSDENFVKGKIKAWANIVKAIERDYSGHW